MDKDLDELRSDIRKTLEVLKDSLLELSQYLDRMRAETRADLERLRIPAQLVDAIVPDPRHPYFALRQPRRDGDSFGSVLPPTGGDTHGTATEVERQRRAEGKEKA